MTKQEQFLRMVQTAVILMHVQGRGQGDRIYRSVIDMDDAIYASERIPDDMTAKEATHDFMRFIVRSDDDLKAEYDSTKWYLRINDK